jgi:mannose/fructose/N-acetylgalactosamine-specific phosphotransferase system component IID
MQNIAFAFSLMPLVKRIENDGGDTVRFLTRHSELFNTHPYVTGPIIGSVVKLEEQETEETGKAARRLKNSLMGPYAAMADPFFSGALKPLAALAAVIPAMKGCIAAPVVLFLLVNPIHFWVRLRGFLEGYRDGKGAMAFLNRLDLPHMSRRIRWISVVLSGIAAAMIIPLPPVLSFGDGARGGNLVVLTAILACYWLLCRGVSQVAILYGSVIVFLVMTAL